MSYRVWWMICAMSSNTSSISCVTFISKQHNGKAKERQNTVPKEHDTKRKDAILTRKDDNVNALGPQTLIFVRCRLFVFYVLFRRVNQASRFLFKPCAYIFSLTSLAINNAFVFPLYRIIMSQTFNSLNI